MMKSTPRVIALCSLLLSLATTPAIAQQIDLVSVNATGVKSNQQSTRPDISADGRYIVFVSIASNLVANDPGRSDVFVKDLVTGQVELVSKATGGIFGNANSTAPVTISADGRYVVFMSFATNLAPGVPDGYYDQFWHDQVTGQTQQVNVAQDGSQANNYSDFAAVSGDGRYVAFRSQASNLVPEGGPSSYQIYVRDIQLGTTQLISRNASGIPQGGGEPDISSDGRYVVYRGIPSGVYVVDAFNCTSAACSVQRADVNNSGQSVSGHSSVLFPKISGNGRYVTWESDAVGYVEGDTNGTADIFVRDTLMSTTSRVSVASDGTQANSFSYTPDISDDGRYVMFTSNATNLAGPDTNGVLDIYRHDRQDGQTIRLTRTSMGGELNNHASYYSRISGNGQRMAFSTTATNAVPADTDATEDVYVVYMTPPNSAPVANAGEDLEVPVGETVQLNGINSTDDNDQYYQLTYQWTLAEKPSGSNAAISASGYIASFLADLPGTYRAELRVTDRQGAVSTPDQVDVTAGLVPAYVFRKVKETPYSFLRDGDAYVYDYGYSQLVAVARGSGLYLDYESSYDSTTRMSSYNYQLTSTDGTTSATLLSRGDLLNGTDTVEYFNTVGFSMDDKPIVYLSTSRTDGNGRKSYYYGLWTLSHASATRLLEYPVPISGATTRVHPWQMLTRGESIVFTAQKLPYSYKEYAYEYQGVQRTARYADTAIYRTENGAAHEIWSTASPIPGLNIAPYSASIIAVSEAGQIVVQVWWPAPTATCSGCWVSAHLLIKVDNTLDVLVRTDLAGNFPGSYVGQVVFSGEQLRVGMYLPVATSSAIWRYDGSDLVSEVGRYVSTGRSAWLYVPYWNFGANEDDLYLGYGCELGLRVDGRFRGVTACSTGYPRTVAGTPVNWPYIPWSIGPKFDRSTLSLEGSWNTRNSYTSDTQYEYASTQYQFLGSIDSDRDGLIDGSDNCPVRPNIGQEDGDIDGTGDVCEDSDADGVQDPDDNCWAEPNQSQANGDDDSYGDACDVCPTVTDDQSDSDGDGIGDACDPDSDGDGVHNAFDNCPLLANTAQTDLDADGEGDACDPDKDGDDIDNEVDGTFELGAFVDASEVTSNAFTDQHRGGRSFGRLLLSSSGSPRIQDSPEDVSGLLIATSGDARFKLCDKPGTTLVVGGSKFTFTCGSVNFDMWSGFVNYDVDGTGEFIVAIPQLAKARVVDQSADETAVIVDPSSAAPVSVEIGDDLVGTIDAATTVVVERVAADQYEVFNSNGSQGSVSLTIAGQIIVYAPGDIGVPVRVSIKPDSSINTIKVGSGGVYPTAILSSATFDATRVDPLSVTLASAPVKLAGQGKAVYSIKDVDGDGRNDMLLQIETSALILNSAVAQLRGLTVDGVAIFGNDFVKVVK